MNETDDRLEILIGRFLDGEISPDDRQWLEHELDANSQARELLDRLRNLRQCSRDAIASEAFQGGASAEDIFERAWQQHAEPAAPRIFKVGGYLRFAAGIAAGLILALMVNYVLEWTTKSPVKPFDLRSVARDIRPELGDRTAVLPVAESRSPDGVTRKVDWYVFTDENGQQWLVEGIREDVVRPASYSEELH